MQVDPERVRGELESRSEIPLGFWKGLANEAERSGDEGLKLVLMEKLDNDLWAYLREDWSWFRRYEWALE